MARKNRELQRLPPLEAQRAVLRRPQETGEAHRVVVSGDPIYGLLRAELEMLSEADRLAPVRRGPKPKRETLLRILSVLERRGLPIRTSLSSPVVAQIAAEVGLSPAQVRDLLHQLRDTAERYQVVD